MPTLPTDLIGRVKRLSLKPSATSALMPLFEAVSNGLHAIDDQHGEKARAQGKVVIEVLREDPAKLSSSVVGFVVSDNGIGLNDENYTSFLKPDSQHKYQRGGKGVGRLVGSRCSRISGSTAPTSTRLDDLRFVPLISCYGTMSKSCCDRAYRPPRPAPILVSL